MELSLLIGTPAYPFFNDDAGRVTEFSDEAIHGLADLLREIDEEGLPCMITAMSIRLAN